MTPPIPQREPKLALPAPKKPVKNYIRPIEEPYPFFGVIKGYF